MTTMGRGRARVWLLSLFLLAPAIGLYAAHVIHGGLDSGRSPTGFIQYDMIYYMANAREHFDSGTFKLTYGNPFSPHSQTPRIYFQPLTLVLALLHRLTRLDPGIVFMITGFFLGLFCVRSAIFVYDRLYGLDSLSKMLGLVCFVWGGGLMAVSGGLAGLFNGMGGEDLFRFDPFGGWWFLNLGRNLIYPTEALYHLLVFTVFLAALGKRWIAMLVLLAVLSVSHPFTGIQFILIFFTWTFLERVYFRSGEIPCFAVFVSVLLLLAHVLYYLVFLPTFPEHASIMDQWALSWLLRAPTLVLAYGGVLLLTLWRLRRPELARNVLSRPENRLLLIWFLVSFVLANHEFAMDPVQPLHFTRGYLWIPLFLLGAPALIDGFQFLLDDRHLGRWRGVVALVILAVVLSDNGIWLADHARKPTGMFFSSESEEVMSWLRQISGEKKDALLITNDPYVAYTGMAYTPLRSWYSHWACTPFAEKKKAEVAAFFDRGLAHSLWRSRDLVVVFRVPEPGGGDGDFDPGAAFTELFCNASYRGYLKEAKRIE